MRPGGADSPSPPCMPGASQMSSCAWSSRRSRPLPDPDPKALACYGLLLRRGAEPEEVWLRFVQGRPVSAITTQFLDWCCVRLKERQVPVLLLVWDNASWHLSRAVRTWIGQHNWQVKQERNEIG